MSTLFYEPSTRTRLSFEGAMGRLAPGHFVHGVRGRVRRRRKGRDAGGHHTAPWRDTATSCVRAASAPAPTTSRGGRDAIIVAGLINAGAGRTARDRPDAATCSTPTAYGALGAATTSRCAWWATSPDLRTVRSLAEMLTNFENVEFVFIAPLSCGWGTTSKPSWTRRGSRGAKDDDEEVPPRRLDVAVPDAHPCASGSRTRDGVRGVPGGIYTVDETRTSGAATGAWW